jgi:hypothetical protein
MYNRQRSERIGIIPVQYQIDAAAKIIRTKCVGPVTLEEVLGHFRALEVDPDCPDCLDVLLDLSEMTIVPQGEKLREVAREISRVRGRVRFRACAIVASADALFGMMRMLEVFAEDQFDATCVFRSRDEAEKWLFARQGGLAGGAAQQG